MPQKNQERTLEAEEHLAQRVADIRKERNWTYEELAERMAAVGCKIHPSGIQKTEKSGRRITVDELVGYSKALEVPVEALINPEQPEASTKELWRDYLGAERVNELMYQASRTYWGLIEDIQTAADSDPDLRSSIEDRYRVTRALRDKAARETAAEDGLEFSTDEEFQEYFWQWWANPALYTARDVLEGRKWQK